MGIEDVKRRTDRERRIVRYRDNLAAKRIGAAPTDGVRRDENPRVVSVDVRIAVEITGRARVVCPRVRLVVDVALNFAVRMPVLDAARIDGAANVFDECAGGIEVLTSVRL